jgi:hypothetical protein
VGVSNGFGLDFELEKKEGGESPLFSPFRVLYRTLPLK